MNFTDYEQSLSKAVSSARDTARWAGFLRKLGYLTLFIAVGIGSVSLGISLGFQIVQRQLDASTFAVFAALGALIFLGAVLAAPLIALSAYLEMGAYKILSDIQRNQSEQSPDVE